MSEITQLIATLKRELKQQGKTYRGVAKALGLSEPSVKRLFATEQFTLERLVEICGLLGLTLAEPAQEAGQGHSGKPGGAVAAALRYRAVAGAARVGAGGVGGPAALARAPAEGSPWH